MPGIRKSASDHRPSRLLMQEALVLLILCILCIDVLYMEPCSSAPPRLVDGRRPPLYTFPMNRLRNGRPRVPWRAVPAGLILAGGLAVLGSQVLAQSGSSGGAGASKSPEEGIQVDVHLVNVLFTARDKKGNLVPNLTRDRVRVFEDGRPQTITNFSRESNQPLAVVLLMDSSSSARASLKVQQEAAIDFFHNTIKRKRDKGMLMTFDSTIDVLQDFVDDPDRLSKAVKSVRIGGGTKMYDAIQVACQEKLAGLSGPRRILVLIGDGDDNMSYETFDSATAVAQRSEVSIYSISTNNSGFFGMAQPKQDKLLKRLAEATGGRAYFPPKIDDLAMSFYRISEELRSQYSVAYRSTNSSRDGAFRRIKINVKGKKVKLQYRKGYYAPTS